MNLLEVKVIDVSINIVSSPLHGHRCDIFSVHVWKSVLQNNKKVSKL